MRKLSIIALMPLLFLMGCGKNDLQGEVTAKEFRPGYSHVVMQPMYMTTCSGNPSVCTQTLTGFIPITYTVPDCHQITVAGKVSGKTCISKEEYDGMATGAYYEGPDVAPEDRQKETARGPKQDK